MADCVVLDTNALMMPFQFKLNIDKEIARLLGDVDILVPTSVVEELSRLTSREAKAALALSAKYQVVETSMSGDDGVIDVARRRRAAVVTNDRGLIGRLTEMGMPVVRLRSGRYLVMTGD